jgi:hypothetical protein
MQLERLEKLSKKKLREGLNGRFQNAADADSLERRSVYYAESDFYLREIERRRARWDRIMEIIIVVMIGAELLLAVQGGDLQVATVHHEEAAFNGLQQSLNLTEKNLEALNQKLQSELDLAYEPSLNVQFDRTKGSLEIENRGKANIELWGERINDRLNSEKHPIVITTGWPNRVSLPTGLMKGIAKGNLMGTVVLYLKTGAEKEYEAVCTLENQRVDEGFSIGVGKVQIKAANWSQKKKP